MAGPDGEDLSHAVGAANPNRHDPTFQTYVAEEAPPLMGGSTGDGIRTTDVDQALVVGEPQTFDWQLSGGGADKSFRGKGRAFIEDKPGTARALTANKTLAVHVPDEAATLTRGSSGDGVSEPGRRREDDENLVVAGFNHQGDDFEPHAEESPPVTSGKGHGGQAVVQGWAQSHQGLVNPIDEAIPALTANEGGVRNNSPMIFDGGDEAPTLRSHPRPGSNDVGAIAYTKTHGAQDGGEDAEMWDEAPAARSLNGMGYATDVVVEGESQAFEARFARNGRGGPSDEVPPLKAQSGETGKGDGAPLIAPSREEYAKTAGAAVRRLTPVECERLQGFPDGWTAIDGTDTPDGPRYAGLGDAVTVNVPRWIIARLVKRERLIRGEA